MLLNMASPDGTIAVSVASEEVPNSARATAVEARIVGSSRRESASIGSSRLSTPPDESRARTISTTEIDGDRGLAAHGPSEVCATHVPAARSAMSGCHVASSFGWLCNRRPLRASS